MLASLLSVLALWALAPLAEAATNLVRMGDYWFSPTNITINPMDTLVWTNVGAPAHDTTANSGLWSSPTFGGTTTYSFRFTNSGYYPYFCAVHVVSHPEQTGTVTVASSGIAPTVSITSPASGTDFSTPASFTFSATASDSDGTVTNVQFFAGTTLLGSDTNSPYSIGASNLTTGSYNLTAVATDNSGLSKTSAVVRIVVGTTRYVKMGDYWFSPTNITINPMDTLVWTNVGAPAHDTTANSGLWASPTFGGTTTFSFRFTNSGFYPYFCAVHIVSHPEQTGTVTVVTAPNIPPTVAITNPPNGAAFLAPASFTLQATAADADGTVTQVQFFQSSTSLGLDTTSPFSIPVSGLAAGSYTFSAVATDNRVATTSSATVTISVTNSPPQSVTLLNPAWSGGDFTFSFLSQAGRLYQVQCTNDLTAGAWPALTNLTGNGSTLSVTNRNPPGAARFYRVESK